MPAALLRADSLLKDLARPARHLPWPALALTILAAGAIYGALMGTYSLASAQRYLMILYAAAKVPLLIFATTAVCLPGFFVMNTVLGLRDDFARVMRAILAGQAALTAALASLAPITEFCYQCGVSYQRALIVNALMFTLATAVGQVVLLRRYRPLTAEPSRSEERRV